MFLIYSALHIESSWLSPTIVYIIDPAEESFPPKSTKQNPKGLNEKRYSIINVNYSRQYYKQYFSNINPSAYRYFDYGLAIWGSISAGGTFGIHVFKLMLQCNKLIIQLAKQMLLL